ncbi:hypothetical protein ACQPXM_24970 [Kribbella sp. CA-253562]|uniref:hypothetical protein n=1 Tax=Kribbella sp. CA-253562 TaxID=3239942 RepID=UPI003D91BF18
MGICKLGTGDLAVVDLDLRVHGVEGGGSPKAPSSPRCPRPTPTPRSSDRRARTP